MMNEGDIQGIFLPQYLSFLNIIDMTSRPLLAHYTSIDVLEKIVRGNEIWFSCPLFMNDLQEMRFGLLEGRPIVEEALADLSFIESYQAPDKLENIRRSFHYYFNDFETSKALDVYVFCLSEHDPGSADGLLSMWRGYGGQGKGAAIVFQTDFLVSRAESPLLIAKVQYKSEEERRTWIRNLLNIAKNALLRNEIPDELLYHFSYHLFELIKLHALLAKHHGFAEEREWRIIYLPDRDTQKMLSGGFSYVIGANGVEPKLKFPIQPLPFEEPASWSLDTIVHQIILGPSFASAAAANAVRKMFQTLGRHELAEKITSSGIPLRPT